MKKSSILTLSAILLFFLLRIGLLISLPIFNDESIYLHWGQIFTHHINEAFFATELDGKPPGTAILFGILTLLPFDPLLTVRFCNILFSFASLLILFSILKKFVSNKFAPLFLFLIATSPLLVLFDALALQESSLTLIATILFALTLSFIRTPKLLTAIGLGSIGAIGMWIKPNSAIFLPSLLVGLFVSYKTHEQRLKVLFVPFLGLITSFLFLFLPLRLHPLWQMIEKKTSERAFSFFELLLLPVGTWADHFANSLSWFSGYLTIPVFLTIIWGILLSFRTKKFRFFLLWALVPIFISLLTARMLTARYLVYTIPILLFFSCFGMMKLTKFRLLIAGTVIIISLITSITLAVSPLSYYHSLNIFPQTQNDFRQYVSGWSSGYGVKEAMQFLDEEARRSPTPVIVTVRLDSGNPEDAVYLYGEKTAKAIVLPENELPGVFEQMKPMNITYPMYFVSRGDQHGLFKSCLTELKQYNKPLDNEYVGIYEIDQPCAMSLIDQAMEKISD